MRYVKVDFANGTDFAITANKTGLAIWSETDIAASQTCTPRQPTHDYLGAASLYAGSGEPVEDYIPLANEQIKVVIAQAGNATSGTFIAIVEH